MPRQKHVVPVPDPPVEDDPAVTVFKEKFRRRLKKMRKEARLTQAALCTQIDFPLASYKHIEGKRASPFPQHKLERLSWALRRSCHYILTGKEWGEAAGEQNRHAA